MIKQLSLLDTEMYQASQSQVDWQLENNECTDSGTDSKYSSHVVPESICTTPLRTPIPLTSGCIEVYFSGGTSRSKKKYYRFTWREKNRVKRRHIPGGNIDSVLAKKRAALIQCEIDLGRTPNEIVEYIKSFCRTAKII